jgi:N-acetylglucosamine malate deacetylase 2
MTTSTVTLMMAPAAPAGLPLLGAGHVLVVTARPGQESADLGGLLYALRRGGASLGLLCLTRGEDSPLNATCARLEAVRPWELNLAAGVLGIGLVAVADYPGGQLDRQPMAELTERVWRVIRQQPVDLLLVIDPETGGPDEGAVAVATCAAAVRAGLPVVASTRPASDDAWEINLGPDAPMARAIQKAAAAAHASQADALPGLVRRLDLRHGREHLRWLAAPWWAPQDAAEDGSTLATAVRR